MLHYPFRALAVLSATNEWIFSSWNLLPRAKEDPLAGVRVNEGMTRDQREDLAEARGRRLIELVVRHLPIEVQVTDTTTLWRLVAPGLIARQAGTLDAILALRPLGRESDAFVLLRSLYEHAVTFAWLAADPGEDRLQQFEKSDAFARLGCDRDARKVGEPLLSESRRSELQQRIAQLSKQMPDLLQLAEGADAFWTGKIDGLAGSGQAGSFRGLYAIAYRHHSSIAHPTLIGLNRVSVEEDGGIQRVQMETRAPDTHGPFGLGNILLALSLYIAGEVIGWPPQADVYQIFETSS
jgi:hypothetical protein